MTRTVAVIGGGYGGIAVAKALDDVADVLLIEPRETFVHNVAALRAVVDPAWIDHLFMSYDHLLARGRVIRDRAVRMDGATVTLGSGERIQADFTVLATGSRCVAPVTGYLAGDLATARQANRHLSVTDQLSVPGHPTVFAIGDLTAIPETKKAQAAAAHAQVAATNIAAAIRNEDALISYQPQPPGISIPLGPAGGASDAPHVGIVDAEATARLKGADLMVPTYAQVLGLAPATAAETIR